MDPYRTLEVSPGASEAELRAAYRRAVQRHHPDHNAGSAESTRRFEEIQDAWAQIRRLRSTQARSDTPHPADDPDLEVRLAAMERELRATRERAVAARQAAAREAAAARAGEAERPSDEELGYVKTDDSFGAILSDARERFLDGLGERPTGQRATERAADLLDEVAAALRGERPKRSR